MENHCDISTSVLSDPELDRMGKGFSTEGQQLAEMRALIGEVRRLRSIVYGAAFVGTPMPTPYVATRSTADLESAAKSHGNDMHLFHLYLYTSSALAGQCWSEGPALPSPSPWSVILLQWVKAYAAQHVMSKDTLDDFSQFRTALAHQREAGLK